MSPVYTLGLLRALAPPAAAADPELMLDMVRVTSLSPVANGHFGSAIAGGDLDGDGFSDVVASGTGAVTLYFGGPFGVGMRESQAVTLQHDYEGTIWWYGSTLAIADLDGDGEAALLVAARSGEGGVLVYAGSAAGVSLRSESLLRPIDQGSWPYSDYGAALAVVGDVYGDGSPEVLVGAPDWTKEGEVDPRSTGAAFLYSGDGTGGPDPCTERRIDAPVPATDEQWYLGFGAWLTGAGDTDNDGYADLAITCIHCGIPECPTCGTVFVWRGGANPTFAAEEAVTAASEFDAGYHTWNYFGYSLDSAGDVNGDDYDDLVIAADHETWLYYGSAEGIDVDTPQLLADDLGSYVAGVGDLDADGFDDVVATGGIGFNEDGEPVRGLVFFGSEGGIDSTQALATPVVPSDGSFGHDVAGVGDVNGDGRSDFAVGATHEDAGAGASEGVVYVLSPICAWYLDADADGYGNPAVSLDSCHEQAGYAHRPDDCDDADPSVHGSLWYTDADADGYGTGEGQLACVEPGGTSATGFDCDDAAAARNPGAEDASIDGVDQDCDDHDGPWVQDTGDCPEEDTGDSGADTAADPDTGVTGDTNGDEPTEVHDPDCGCSSNASPAWLAAAGLALFSRRRTCTRAEASTYTPRSAASVTR